MYWTHHVEIYLLLSNGMHESSVVVYEHLLTASGLGVTYKAARRQAICGSS